MLNKSMKLSSFNKITIVNENYTKIFGKSDLLLGALSGLWLWYEVSCRNVEIALAGGIIGSDSACIFGMDIGKIL